MPNSVKKAMIILRLLSDAKGQAVTLAKLAEQTGFPKSTIAHIVKSLAEDKYIQRVSHREGYVIGPELHLLTRYGRYMEDVIQECHPLLRYLNQKSGGTAAFVVIKGNKKYIIDRIANDGVYADEQANLLVDDLYRTVTGRVILANLPLAEAMEIWEALGVPGDDDTWPGIENLPDFLKELENIRKQQCYFHATADACFQWFGFAAPVFRNAKCIGALGLSIRRTNDKSDINEDEKKAFKRLIIKCKKELERRLQLNL